MFRVYLAPDNLNRGKVTGCTSPGFTKMSFEYETVLLVKKEVFVYNLPPRQSNRGYRASDWNLESPAWTGRMRVVAKGKTLYIKLEDSVSGQLYAQCPVEEFPGIAVEQVLDSSRYFAIRLMADNGRTMYVGIGFAERSDSFDFNVAIQDHFTHQKQEEEAERQASQPQPSEPALDLGLKEGQRLRLNINTKRPGEGSSTSKTTSRPMPSLKLGTPAGPGLLPPPPSGARSRSNRGAPPAPSAAPSGSSGSKSNADLLVDLFQSPAVAPAPPAAAAVTTNSDPLLDWTS
nr:unnamed protein product [Spirometra erinaceieuropaei]